MGESFLGLGFKNLLGVAIFTILFIVLLKVITIKHPIKGVTEVVQTV